jgi:hypothetical protein
MGAAAAAKAATGTSALRAAASGGGGQHVAGWVFHLPAVQVVPVVQAEAVVEAVHPVVVCRRR